MSFGGDLGKFEVNAINATEKTVRGTAIALWRAVILDSPVDSGRFRGNWFASQGSPVMMTTTSVDKIGAETVNEATKFTLGASNWQNLWLSNNIVYAGVIEFGGYPNPAKRGSWNKKKQRYEINTIGGYSDQAPKGVVRVNVTRFQSILDDEAKKN